MRSRARLSDVAWHLGLIAWLVAVPAVLGFIAGRQIELHRATRLHFEILLSGLGLIAGVLLFRSFAIRRRQ